MNPHFFFEDPDPAVFLIADPDSDTNSALKLFKKYLMIFLKDFSNVKNQNNGPCANLKHLNKIAIITNFLAFFLFLFKKISHPYPHFEGGSGSGRENECISMKIRIHSPAWRFKFNFNKVCPTFICCLLTIVSGL